MGAHAAKVRLAESSDAPEASTERMVPRDFRFQMSIFVGVVGVYYLRTRMEAARKRCSLDKSSTSMPTWD